MTHRRDPLPTDVEASPALPERFHEAIAEGLVSLGLTLDPAVMQAISDHVRLLLAWTEAINLTAIRDPVAVARDHVLDSLTAIPLLRRHGPAPILDLGSGGGFPGLPLALALGSERALLVESVGKKARFLATVIDALGLRPRVAVAATRIETLAADRHHRAHWPILTARAVGPLAELIELAAPLATTGGVLVAWKRRRDPTGFAEPLGRGGRIDGSLVGTAGEFAAARRSADLLGFAEPVVHPVHLAGLDDHVLVVVDKIAATPPGYPRDPALRKRRPW
ncbi:MAG: 16S rRNA (guanine(527)-N(7))-methyltransferase RsmG [Candidatus Limnocylindrales bacterium]